MHLQRSRSCTRRSPAAARIGQAHEGQTVVKLMAAPDGSRQKAEVVAAGLGRHRRQLRRGRCAPWSNRHCYAPHLGGERRARLPAPWASAISVPFVCATSAGYARWTIAATCRTSARQESPHLGRNTTLVGCRSVRRCLIRGPFSRIHPVPPVLVAFLSQGVSSSREVS